jgi:hypothetical protein
LAAASRTSKPSSFSSSPKHGGEGLGTPRLPHHPEIKTEFIAMRDIARNLSPIRAILPATLTASPSRVSVDLQGFDSCAFLLDIGVGGITFDNTNRIDIRVEHSDDGSTWTNVGPNDVIGAPIAAPSAANGFVRSLVAAKAAADTTDFSYVGSRRFVAVTPIFGGTHGVGTLFYGAALRGNPHIAPVV